MKKAHVTIAIIGLVVFGIACSPKVAKTGSTTSTIEAFDITKYSETQIAQGAQIMSTSCNRCHKLREPQKYTVEKWERVLKRMIPKAKLSEQDADLVKAYIFKNAKTI